MSVKHTPTRLKENPHTHQEGVACIDVHNLSYTYPSAERPVLDSVSFSVQAGEYVALLGPNGGGKTTLLKIMTGLLKPKTGEFDLHCIADEPSAHAHIGYVPQSSGGSPGYFPATVYEIVLSGRTPRRGLFHRLTAADRELAREAIRLVGLEGCEERMITDISGGERQKVFIARALAGRPSILLLDEPTTDIDSRSRLEFYSLIRELNRDLKLTILLVSHDIDTVKDEVSRVIYLDRKVIFDGSVAEFTKHNIHNHDRSSS